MTQREATKVARRMMLCAIDCWRELRDAVVCNVVPLHLVKLQRLNCTAVRSCAVQSFLVKTATGVKPC